MVNKNVSRGKYANNFGSDEDVADGGTERCERRTAALYFRRRILHAAPRRHWRAGSGGVGGGLTNRAKSTKTPYTAAANARNNKALGPRVTRIPTQLGGFRPVHSSGSCLLCGCTTVSGFSVPNQFENQNVSKNTHV